MVLHMVEQIKQAEETVAKRIHTARVYAEQIQHERKERTAQEIAARAAETNRSIQTIFAETDIAIQNMQKNMADVLLRKKEGIKHTAGERLPEAVALLKKELLSAWL